MWVLYVLACYLVTTSLTQAQGPNGIGTSPESTITPFMQNISGEKNEKWDNESTKLPLIEMQGSNAEVQEKRSSLAIFFILLIIVLATLIVHALIVTKFHYIPESLAIVILGAVIGQVLSYSAHDWRDVESLSPGLFFLVLLPPIIFESGYNLHKGDFFAQMFPILTFAIIGTAISALVIGSSLYILGQADLIYRLTLVESFAFGSMISAVDPVATLAIFQALNVEPILYMLVFGESMLNDAVAIVLTSTALEMAHYSLSSMSASTTFWMAFARFNIVFFVSAFLGAAIGFVSALLFKHVDLRKTPSLEFALLLVFAYLPYGLAEAISLSGIMAILFCSITMSQYTHFNVSPVTQITFQQTFRTLAFVAETCTFAYLGMALFTINLLFNPMFIMWSILLCLIGRALNVFPLSFAINKCRNVQISLKNQFIMWFSGLRGAVAFVLALHLSIENETTKKLLLTTTLTITLFTIICLGGSTLPLLKILNELFPEHVERVHKRKKTRRRQKSEIRKRQKSSVMLSKTQEMALFDQSEHMTSTTEDMNISTAPRRRPHHNNSPSFASRFNQQFVQPLFIRKFTSQEVLENRMKLRSVTSEVLKEGGGVGVENDVISQQQSSSDELFGIATDPLL